MRQSKPFIRQANEKWSIKSWVVSHFPENYEQMTYCEPFGGSAHVLFHKSPSKIEIYNDRDDTLVSLFRALRDEPSELNKRLLHQKDSKEVFDKMLNKKVSDDYMEVAAREFFLRKLSKGANKKDYQKLKGTDSLKSHLNAISDFSVRIKSAFFHNKSAIEVIKTISCDESLVYCDPPYLHDSKGSKALYDSEMKPEEHIDLCRALEAFSGKIVLSGCASPLYNRLYKNWNMSKKKLDNGASEIIWKNF